MSKRWVITFVTVVCLGVLCLVSVSGEAKKTTISFMTWTAGVKPIEDFFKKVLDDFMKKHPDIEVKSLTGESRDLSRLFTLFAGGVGPDVFMIECPTFPQIARAGVLEDLSPFLKKDSSISLDEWFPPAIEAGRWEGKLLALPTVLGSTLWVIYNPEVFDECGLLSPGELASKGQWNLETLKL